MKKITKVVIVDTGLDPLYKSSYVKGGVSVKCVDEKFRIEEGYVDNIGHGTGTADIILKNSDCVELYVVKVYDDDIYISCEKLCYALEYIKENLEFDLIQVSSGLTVYSEKMHEIIREIVCEKKKCVISAFDNEGAVSYPAAFEEVIGIDVNANYQQKDEYDLVEGNVIDIRGGNAFYRMAFLDGKSNIAQGSSFLTSYFTACIANMQITNYEKKVIMSGLKKGAKRIYRTQCERGYSAKDFVANIKRAIVFPFNKEVHSIAAFEDMLPFEVVGYYDIKHKFIVGKEISEVLKYTANDKLITNIDDLEWDSDFDTVICGHVGEISKILKRDFIAEIQYMCSKYGKKVYFFDDLNARYAEYKNSSKVFSPFIEENTNLNHRFGKLRMVNKPVLAVLGTSSRQGKFTIQLSLMKELKRRGFKIDGIGSEPSSPFFGYSHVFAFGYGSLNPLNGREMIRVLNEMTWDVEKSGIDLMLTGGQSGTLGYDFLNEQLLAIEQHNFLLGTNPDGVILCVNEIDEMDYIIRTINYIEAVTSAKVIAIVISETHSLLSYSVFGRKMTVKKTITGEELRERFMVPIFSLSSLDVERLANEVIEYYE